MNDIKMFTWFEKCRHISLCIDCITDVDLALQSVFLVEGEYETSEKITNN